MSVPLDYPVLCPVCGWKGTADQTKDMDGWKCCPNEECQASQVRVVHDMEKRPEWVKKQRP